MSPDSRMSKRLDVDEPQRWVANITIYPAESADHSSHEDLSALAGYTKALLRHLSPEVRRRNTVLTNMKGDSKRTFLEDGLEVRECWKKGHLSYVFHLFREIATHREWRVLHLQHEFNQFGGALTLPLNLLLLFLFRFLLRRKVAVTLHEVLSLSLIDRDFLQRASVSFPAALVRLVVRIYYSVLIRIAHSIVVQHEHFARVLREEYGARAPITLVRIGTEELTLPSRSLARERFQLNSATDVVLYFGALDWYKGLDLLVDGFSLLDDSSTTLLIAGGQPKRTRDTPNYKDWWQRLHSKITNSAKIRLLGFVDDKLLPFLFASADLVVLPHIVPQRVSAVFNQAASFGLPIIASDVFKDQAHPEMLFSPNPQALVAKLRWALDGHLDELRTHSLAFRSKNHWRESASEMTRLHEFLARPNSF